MHSFYFDGWYLKHQSGEHTVAFIPAFHIGKNGEEMATLQIITEKKSYYFEFPAEVFQENRRHFAVRVGDSVFTERGCRIQVLDKKVLIEGRFQYGAMSKPSYDIMGPFVYLPGMQCRHRVLSMFHTVKGYLSVNGTQYDFSNGVGYIEGDRGREFPDRYVWSQCSGPQFCAMVSVAEVPVGPIKFLGCISAILYEEKEYRLATYLGARVLFIDEKEVLIKQGRLQLWVKRMSENAKPLCAPQAGGMERIIHESAQCSVYYKLKKGKKVIFEFVSEQAGFETGGM